MKQLDPGGRKRDTEFFGDGDRFYFIDVVKQAEDRHFVAITRSDRDPAGKGYRRSQVILFEDDLPIFIEALTMVLGRFSAGTSFSVAS
jgi:hypothetical protein